MTVESVTQAVSNLALEFGDDKARSGAMVCIICFFQTYCYVVIVLTKNNVFGITLEQPASCALP
jgi:hypothetical protein